MVAVRIGVRHGRQRPKVFQPGVIGSQQTDVATIAGVLQVTARPLNIIDPVGLHTKHTFYAQPLAGFLKR